MTPYYADEAVTLYHGRCEDVLPALELVAAVITDPPYSEHTHKSVRSAKMLANDRGGKYGADVRRNVDLGFEHLTAELRAFCAEQFARLASRWVLVFSDVESDHLWRTDLQANGLDYVRTGAWIKIGSTPQFSGDRSLRDHRQPPRTRPEEAPQEAVALCRFTAACCPSQKIDEYTADAWGLLLEGVRFEDAKEAVVKVAQKQPWVSPAEIISEVKKLRRKRIDEFGPITPPADLDPDDTVAYRDWWQNVQRAIADGDLRPKELDLPKREAGRVPASACSSPTTRTGDNQ
jgi:hypothetical protein